MDTQPYLFLGPFKTSAVTLTADQLWILQPWSPLMTVANSRSTYAMTLVLWEQALTQQLSALVGGTGRWWPRWSYRIALCALASLCRPWRPEEGQCAPLWVAILDTPKVALSLIPTQVNRDRSQMNVWLQAHQFQPVASSTRQHCPWGSRLTSNTPGQKSPESGLNALLVPHGYHENQAHRDPWDQARDFPAPLVPTSHTL